MRHVPKGTWRAKALTYVVGFLRPTARLLVIKTQNYKLLKKKLLVNFWGVICGYCLLVLFTCYGMEKIFQVVKNYWLLL